MMLLVMNISLIAQSSDRGARSEYNVRDFGAKGDGTTIDTEAIAKAVDAIALSGGGTLHFPPGTYLTGTIYMVDHLTLNISAGARILGVPFDHPHYGRRGETRGSLIEGANVEHVAIVGEGIVDGGGISSGCNTPGCGEKGIRFSNARHVTVRGITILHGGQTAFGLGGSHDVKIHSILMDTNRDGLHVNGTNITISDVILNSDEDDVLVFKSGPGNGFHTPTSNVTITNAYVSGFKPGSVYDGTYQGGGGIGRIKFGSGSVGGGYRNVTISNVIFDRCKGLDLAVVDGSGMENINISNIVMRDVSNSPIYLRLGDRSPSRAPKNPPPGILRNISISNLLATGADSRFTSVISGIPGHPIENVTLSDIRISYTGGGTLDMAQIEPPENEGIYPEPGHFGEIPAYGFYVRHVNDLQFNNVSVEYEAADMRPAFVFKDVENAQLNGISNEREPNGAPPVDFRGNNRDVTVFNSASLPQAEYGIDEMELSAEEVAAGEPFGVSAVIEAEKEGMAAITLYINGEKVRTQYTWLLPEKQKISFNDLTLYSGGGHSIRVGDAEAKISVIPQEGRISLSDLKVYSPWVDDLNVNARVESEVLTAGEEAIIRVLARNPGSYEKERTINFRIENEAAANQTVKLGPGESTEVIFRHTFPNSGNHTVTVGEIEDTVYAWNRSGEFHIEDLKIIPETPVAKENVRVLVTVSDTEFSYGGDVVLYLNDKAVGSKPAESSSYAGDDDDPVGNKMVIARKDEQKQVEFSIRPSNPGRHILSVRNAVGEEKRRLPFEVYEPLQLEDLRLSARKVQPHELFTVRAKLINSGPFKVIQTVHLSIDGTIAQDKTIEILPAQIPTIEFPVRLYEKGKHVLTINDLSSQVVRVIPGKGEPRFQYGKVEAGREILIPHESTTLQTRIMNITSGKHKAHVELKINDKAVQRKELELFPGESRAIPFTHEFPKKGVYEVAIGEGEPAVIKVGMNNPPTLFRDHSGHGNHAKVLANPLWVEGRFGKGLKFYWPDDWENAPPSAYSRIETPMGPNDLGPAGTVSLWYKPTWDYRERESFREAIIENHTGFVLFDAGKKETVRFFHLTWGDEGEFLSFNVEDTVDRDYEAPSDDTAESGQLSPVHQFKSDQWYHIVATWDFTKQPRKISLFINGRERESTEMEGQDFAEFDPFTIGAYRHDFQPMPGSANGIIDEIRAYNRVLNGEEIERLYSDGEDIREGMLLYLNFEE